jgi:tRNA (mo5U34)-methyltransferase
VADTLVFQSMLRGSNETSQLRRDYDFHEIEQFADPSYPVMYFVEDRYAGDPTSWWIPNRACAEAMLRRGVRHRRPSGRRGIHLPPQGGLTA